MRIDTNDTVDLIMQGLPVSGQAGEVIVARPEYTLHEAQQLFLEYNLHHLPVVAGEDDETVIGIVTTYDVMRFYAACNGVDPKTVQLRAIMTTEPVTVTADTTIRDAVHILANAHFQALPVVNGNERIVGIVTTRDVVRYLEAYYRRPPLSIRPPSMAP